MAIYRELKSSIQLSWYKSLWGKYDRVTLAPIWGKSDPVTLTHPGWVNVTPSPILLEVNLHEFIYSQSTGSEYKLCRPYHEASTGQFW